MNAILFTVSIFMVFATVLPLIPKDDWWIRGFDFPRLQIISISLATLICYLLFANDPSPIDQIIFSSLALCLIYQIYMVFPYTYLANYQVEQSSNLKSKSSFSLLCANVQMKNRHSSKLKKLVRRCNPDVFLAIETNKWWLEELSELETIYPHSVKQPQDNMYGMILYSKIELQEPSIQFRVQDDIPSIKATVKLQNGPEIKLYCLHPRPPFPTGSDKSTERDVELLLVAKEIKDTKAPTIVLGDMNDVAWSKTNYLFQDISGLLDPRVGRGFFNTFHARYPFIRFPLDHFFHSNHFRLANFRRLDYIGSDHFPVFIKLSFEADASYKQEELTADESEEQEAEEKIQKEV